MSTAISDQENPKEKASLSAGLNIRENCEESVLQQEGIRLSGTEVVVRMPTLERILSEAEWRSLSLEEEKRIRPETIRLYRDRIRALELKLSLLDVAVGVQNKLQLREEISLQLDETRQTLRNVKKWCGNLRRLGDCRLNMNPWRITIRFYVHPYQVIYITACHFPSPSERRSKTLHILPLFRVGLIAFKSNNCLIVMVFIDLV